MTPPPELSIIIVNWKSADYVKKCLESIRRTGGPLRLEIIVIDSASFDGCGEMLARDFPEARYIQCRENVGFGKANNLAAQEARAGTLLLLNPDTEVREGAIFTLYTQLHALPSAGAVGAKLLNSDLTLQTSCVRGFPTVLNQCLDADVLMKWFPRARIFGISALSAPGGQPSAVEALSGACIMTKASLFRDVGMFSSDFYMYCEDTDLCYKIMQAGYKNYYVPEAVIVHHGGGSSRQSRNQFSTVMMKESNLRFVTKTRGRLYGWLFRLAMMCCAFCRVAVLAAAFPLCRLRGNHARAIASLRKWAAIASWSLGAQTWVKRPG